VTRETIAELPGAVHALRNRLPDLPEIVVVLGSGLADLVDQVERPVTIPFAEIPGFPSVTVEGHPGRYVFGGIEGRRVLLQAGRFHLYEGYPTDVVGIPVRVAHALGAETMILTNAAGGIDRRLEPGALMLVEDHINLQWRSPLIGRVAEEETRWPDMSAPYDPDLQAVALAAARSLGIRLARGTYAGVLGPSYETPAEVRMLARLGADAVGMSTVPETLLARALGLRVAAFSVIANPASGLGGGVLSHDDVTAAGRRAGDALVRLLRLVIRDALVS
jgi:purine-nucleoside phosphorylase